MQIALFAIAWLAALAYYFFLFGPFKAKLNHELRQVINTNLSSLGHVIFRSCHGTRSRNKELSILVSHL